MNPSSFKKPIKRISRQLTKVDMHVHSCFSRRPSSWVLKKIGCAESYTDPMTLYRTLKQQEMGLITITDHNTIEGCLEIAHLDDTFISEEVTTYFPEDQCKIHVLVYNITESQHGDISGLRENVFDLVDYLNQNTIVHALAHPLYNVNGLLEYHHIEQCLLLFRHFELNGGNDALSHTILKDMLAGLNAEHISTLENQYNMSAHGERPWEKHLISGSDDHSSLYMGTSYTETRYHSSVKDYLADITRGQSNTVVSPSTPETMAHNFYSIIYQFYQKTVSLNKDFESHALPRFLNAFLNPPGFDPREHHARAGNHKKSTTYEFLHEPILHELASHAKEVIENDHDILSFLLNTEPDLHNKTDRIWMKFVNHASNRVMKKFADKLLNHLKNADLPYLFSILSSSASIYFLLSPYFITYSMFSRDRALSDECRKKHGIKSGQKRPKPCVATFTDTFNEINGVATVIQSQVDAARLTGKSLTLITCEPDRQGDTNIKSFEPIGRFDLPEYKELNIYYPPFLDILSYCYNEGFTRIHAETPGPMGLAAMAVAHLLNIPFSGTYHTSVPQTFRELTGDTDIEGLLWKYIVWFYGKMEKVYVPSETTARELVEKGLPQEKVCIHPWGVNTSRFHPKKRNGFFSRHYGIDNSQFKMLYVGRVSREKNLHVFEDILHMIQEKRQDVSLVVVGEGPYLSEMKETLKNFPVVFTGYLTGEDLAEAYASSDLFVFPSTVDTMGNVVVEAQASGLPVIVTDQGGPRENMVNQETGFVVSGETSMADQIAQAVCHLCDNPDLLKTMKSNAREYTQNRSLEKNFLSFWNGGAGLNAASMSLT